MGLSVRLKKELGGFSLDVEWEMVNETAALFGYSGAGKTMTFQMISGLMRPDKGEIRLDDKVLYDSSAGVNLCPQERSLGYVFQNLALFPHMTVLENILYGAPAGDRKAKKSDAETMMEVFRILNLRDKYPGTISGGQKQRVALARALMTKPKMLLLDEPFSGLDYPIRIEMRKVLEEIREEFGIPVVLITHDLEEACSLADRMIIYAGGKVVQTGSPEEVLTGPADPELRRLFGIDLPGGRAVEKFFSGREITREAPQTPCGVLPKPVFSES
jgi:molybdate transport system ATP-binding protein